MKLKIAVEFLKRIYGKTTTRHIIVFLAILFIAGHFFSQHKQTKILKTQAHSQIRANCASIFDMERQTYNNVDSWYVEPNKATCKIFYEMDNDTKYDDSDDYYSVGYNSHRYMTGRYRSLDME